MKQQSENKSNFEQYDRPSKSSVKRDMLALTDLGRVLCEMPYDKLKRAPLGERLLIEILEFHKCKSFGAKKRQMQFIGKLIREEEHEEIQAWVNGETVEQKLKVLHLHAAEQWRDRLIIDPNLLSVFIENYPSATQENLNPIIRQAIQERLAKKPPRNFRHLFQIIYRLIEEKDSKENE
jgi:ribosome-associated protein